MHPPGESMGSIYRVRNLCQGLTELSHKCFIFTPFNYYEDWGPLVEFITVPVISSRGEISKQIYKVIRNILDIQILSNFTILNPKFFNLTMTRISQSLLKKIKEDSINLDVLIGETEIGGLILTKIKDALEFPIIVDYQNYWPEELVEHRIIKRNSRRYNYLVNLEKKIIKNSDFIITPSQALKNFIMKQFLNGKSKKINSVINGGRPILEKPKKKELPPKIINAGMVAQRSNLKLFFQSIPYLLKEYPNAEIYITKKGEKLKETMKLAKKMRLNINFYWKDTYKEFIDLLSNCHLGVVSSTYNLTRKLGFVTKIYDYFSVGIPVVGNDIGGWTSIITKEKVGLLSKNEPRDLAAKIIDFIDNPDMLYAYGERAIELLKGKYNVKVSAQNLIRCIESAQN